MNFRNFNSLATLYFSQAEKLNDKPHLWRKIDNKYQTFTYFGLEKNVLKNFILNNNLSGIDRIVPIGQALEMDFYWDGYDINKTLTRVVDIK